MKDKITQTKDQRPKEKHQKKRITGSVKSLLFLQVVTEMVKDY